MTDEQKEFAIEIEKKFQLHAKSLEEGKITEKQFSEKIESLKAELKNDSKFVAMEKTLAEISEQFKELVLENEKRKNFEQNSKGSFDADLKSAIEKVKEFKSKGSTEKTILFKSAPAASDPMTIANNLTGQVIVPSREPGINGIVRRVFILRALAAVGTVASNLIEWVEQLATLGAAAMTGEGVLKSKMNFSWELKDAKVKKITALTKISEEMLADFGAVQAEINSNLTYQIALQEETQLLSGDGNGENLNGITKYAQTLDLASLADSVPSPNFMDVIGAAVAQILINGQGMFTPSAIILNPADDFAMKHGTKDTEGNYIIPTFFTQDGASIAGLRILTSNTIPAGYFLVGDFAKFNIRDRESLRIEMGYDSDDFSKNFVSIRAEKRLGTFVKGNDIEAFVYDSFANGLAFINKAS